MIYGEMEFIGIADIPRINTMFFIDNTQWAQWKVSLKDENLEILTGCRVMYISFEDILLVDRPLPQAILSKLQNSSKHGAVIVIDYKKDATIGIGEVVSSLILAGKKSDISNLKYMLMSLLGLKVDPLIGTIKPEDIRLLCLLASGLNSVEMLTPIFDGNEELVNKTFASLKKKKLVDEYATLTPLGTELVDRVKGVEKKKLGSNTQEDFDNLTTMWSYLDSNSIGAEDTLRVIFKCGSSKLYGNLAIADIKKFVRTENIKNLDIEIPENTYFMDLIADTKDKSNILIRSRDYSIMIALYGILNQKEDIQIRILFCFYLGHSIESEILELLNVPAPCLEKHCKTLVYSGLLDWPSKKLTNTGLNLIHKKIMGDVSVLFEWDSFDYKCENFKRIEESRKECAKKKVLDMLQSRYNQRNSSAEVI